MSKSKRYYWIKLRTDFFSMNEIDFLMSQKNGSDYVVLYQMLCLNTANTNGVLVNKIGEMIVPFDIDKIVRDTKYFDYDTVIVALELYKKLGLIYEDNNKCLIISNYDEMVGSETSSAKRVREYRERKKEQKALQCNSDVTYNVAQENRDKSIDIRDKDKEKDKEKDVVSDDLKNHPIPAPFITIITNQKEEYPITHDLVNQYKELYPNVDVEQELKKMKAWSISNPSKRKTKRGMLKFVNSWLSREQDKPKPIKRKEIEPDWLDDDKSQAQKEQSKEDEAEMLYRMYNVQRKCGQTEKANETAEKYKALTGNDIEDKVKDHANIMAMLNSLY